MSGNTDRRRRAQFEAIALPHLDAAYALARWLTRNESGPEGGNPCLGLPCEAERRDLATAADDTKR